MMRIPGVMMNSQKKMVQRSIILLFSVVMWIHGPAHGQDTLIYSDTIQLEEFVVVGRRTLSSLKDRPEAISLLNRKSLESLSPMNMPDAMHAMPGVFMQKTNNGGGSPFIRGLTGYHTLIMVDGIRLNNAIFRSGPNQYLNTVDPLMIEQIEVLRGPGSVQYGTDAIGGTVDLRSEPLHFAKDGIRIGGNIYGKWMSHQMEKTGRAQLEVSTRQLAVSAGVSRKIFGNIEAGGDLGELEHTSYDEYAVDVKAGVQLTPSQSLLVAWQHHKQNNVQLYHKLITDEYTTYEFDPQKRDLIYLRHEYTRETGLISGFRTTLSLHQSDETRKKQREGSYDFYKERDLVNSYGLSMELLMKSSGNWNSVSGADFYYDHVGSSALKTDLLTGEETLQRGLYPDDSYMSNVSLFTLHTLKFRNLSLNGGLRYNHFILGVTDELFGDLTIRPDALVGGVGVSYQFVRNTELSFNISNAFRAPNINDVSSFGIADFRYEVPNFNLAPEKSLTNELGIKTDQKLFSAALFLYHNALKDLMVNVKSTYQGQDSIDGVQVYTRENAGKAYVQGVEGEFWLRPARMVSLQAYLIYTYGQNVTGNEPLRRIPPLNGLLGLHLHLIRNLDIVPEWQFAGEQTRLSSGDQDDSRIPDGGTPAWNVLNLRFSYRMAGFRINAGLLNLLDTAYRTHGSGVDEVGRSIYFSLMYSFGSVFHKTE
jgi:iron complex outermembrane receptor protein/hemoglobin/transferrin/lactoferrin receptor protein